MLENNSNPYSLSFHTPDCQSHMLSKENGICVEWDDDVLNDPNTVAIRRIEKMHDEKIIIMDQFPY